VPIGGGSRTESSPRRAGVEPAVCVAVILANPRYTGREVWRRHQCATPGGGRRVIPAEWALSESLAHPALVSEADFVAVQPVRAARVNHDGVVRRYVLAGLIRCGLCGRLMDAHWVNGRVPLSSWLQQRPVHVAGPIQCVLTTRLQLPT